MQIRQLTPVEGVQYHGICTTVFFDMGRADVFAQLKNPEEHLDTSNPDVLRLGAINDKGQVESALVVRPYTIRMNGKDVKMGGIGGVVTKPECRGKGHVTKIMVEAFADMDRKGQIFSFLYPFSYGYYRKLGYEICKSETVATIPLDQLEGYPYPVDITPFTPGDDITPYKEVYETFTKNRNLAFVRDDDFWREITLKRDPYQNLEFTFLTRDAQGKPNAYVLYAAEKGSDDHGNTLRVKEIAYTTVEGLHGVFGFFAKLGAEFNHLRWHVPADFDVRSLFPDGYEISISNNAGGMNRLVNVAECLKTLNPPVWPTEESVVVDVVDKFLPRNTGAYKIAWDSAGLTVEKVDCDAPDLSLSVETLAQLVTGYINMEEAGFRPDVKVHNKALALAKLFPKKKLHIVEFF